MNWKIKTALGTSALLMTLHAAAQITFYQDGGFRGPVFTTDRPVADFRNFGFNDRASSVVVDHGRWQVCSDARFAGRCVVLRRGAYDSLGALGLNDRISSVRPIGDVDQVVEVVPPPLPEPTYQYRRRPSEALFEVPVGSAHAVMGPPDRRCWVERQQVAEPRNDPNVGGAVVGALIGGILGHQIGHGTGRDVATVGGAVVGGTIGANANGGGGTTVYNRDVRRCENVVSGPPAYWEVTYNFRGVEHVVQMSAPPGPKLLVNNQGEPRQ